MSTVQITAADVNKLRQQTGAGMMDCKKALTEANGDFEAAIDNLRKKGAKVAASRQDRESNEGVVIAKTTADGKRGVIVEFNCETDFVAKNGWMKNTICSVVVWARTPYLVACRAHLGITYSSFPQAISPEVDHFRPNRALPSVKHPART